MSLEFTTQMSSKYSLQMPVKQLQLEFCSSSQTTKLKIALLSLQVANTHTRPT